MWLKASALDGGKESGDEVIFRVLHIQRKVTCCMYFLGFPYSFLKLFSLWTLLDVDTSYTFLVWIPNFVIHRQFMKMKKIQAKIAKMSDSDSTLVQDG